MPHAFTSIRDRSSQRATSRGYRRNRTRDRPSTVNRRVQGRGQERSGANRRSSRGQRNEGRGQERPGTNRRKSRGRARRQSSRSSSEGHHYEDSSRHFSDHADGRRSNPRWRGPLGKDTAKPHRSARAAKRTCLANASCQLAVDLPVVARGIKGTWRRWIRKPCVSKPLKFGSDGMMMEQSLIQDYDSSSDDHVYSDVSSECTRCVLQQDSLERRNVDPEIISTLLRYVGDESAPAPLVRAVMALTPPDISLGRKAKYLGRWLSKSSHRLQEYSKLVPKLVDAVHQVCKLDQTAIPLKVPDDLRVDVGFLVPSEMTIDTKFLNRLRRGSSTCLDLALSLEDEQRRRALAQETLLETVVKLFGPDGLPALDVRYRHLSSQEHSCAKISALPSRGEGQLPARISGAPAFVHSLEAFQANLTSFSHNLLRNLDLGPDRLVVGGSSTMACAMPFLPPCLLKHLNKECGAVLAKHVLDFVGLVPDWLDAETGCFAGADIDIFVLGSNMEEAQERFLEAADQLYKNMCASSRHIQRENHSDRSRDHVSMAQTGHTITFFGRYPLRHVQLVAYVAKDIEEMLAFVDLDCTAMVYDGSNVWAATRAIRAHATGYNVVPLGWLRYLDPCGCSHVPSRVLKYSSRGFGTLVFQRCSHKPSCNLALHSDTAKMIASIKTLQTAPADAVALVKESLRFKRHFAQDVENMNQRDFYGAQAIFPGIPRSPNLTPAEVEQSLERQFRQQGSSAVAAPEPLHSLDMLRDRVHSVVQPKIDKCSAFIMDPRRCH